MVEIPGSLVERLRTRQAVLITGLGCSELVGAPGFPDIRGAPFTAPFV